MANHSTHPRHEPGYRCSWPFSDHSRVYASIFEPGGPLPLRQNALSGKWLPSGHPRTVGTGQTLEGSSVNPVPVVAEHPSSVALDGPGEASAPKPAAHHGSRHEWNAPKPCGSTRVPWLPVPAAGPPTPATRAAIFRPTLAPGTCFARANSFSLVVSCPVKLNAFMRIIVA